VLKFLLNSRLLCHGFYNRFLKSLSGFFLPRKYCFIATLTDITINESQFANLIVIEPTTIAFVTIGFLDPNDASTGR